MRGPKSDKTWADAIKRAVNRYHEEKDAKGKKHKIKYINVLADNLVKQGVKGDIQALREIGDRLDGKPKQAVDANHTGDMAFTIVTGVPNAADD